MQKSIRPVRSGAVVVFPVVFLVVSALFFPLFARPAFAQAATEETDDDRLTILITASRFAETADETLAPVTVITRKDIEEKQATTLEEALRTVPGITLGNSGGVGKLTSVFLRGTESNHVLVLVDGVKTGSVHSGAFKFENFPVDQIERIEVVRGPRSSLYGSEAIGGVIQIFTRKGQSGKARPQVSVGVGTHDTKIFDGSVSGGDTDGWFSIGASVHETAGYDACTYGGVGNFAGCGVDAPDDDGYENASIALRGGAALNDAVAIEGGFFRAEAENEFDDFSGTRVEDREQIASAKLTVQANEQWQSSLSLGASDETSQNFNGKVRGSFFDSKRQQASWKNDFDIDATNRLVVGLDYIEDKGRENNYNRERGNIGIFGLWRTQVDDSDFELAVRNDDDDQFGAHGTGSVAWGRNIGNGNRLVASAATAFKAPTFNELYDPDPTNPTCMDRFVGNPGLEPEESKNIGVGFKHENEQLSFEVNLYRTEIKNLITSRPDTNRTLMCPSHTDPSVLVASPVWQSINVDKVKILGIELSAATRMGGLDWAANFGIQDAEEASGERKGDALGRRPKMKLDLDVSRRSGRWSLGGNIFAQSETEVDYVGSPESPLAGFGILNLRVQYQMHRDWSAGLKINNVLDKEHETAGLYPQDGINFMATLRYAPAD